MDPYDLLAGRSAPPTPPGGWPKARTYVSNAIRCKGNRISAAEVGSEFHAMDYFEQPCVVPRGGWRAATSLACRACREAREDQVNNLIIDHIEAKRRKKVELQRAAEDFVSEMDSDAQKARDKEAAKIARVQHMHEVRARVAAARARHR